MALAFVSVASYGQPMVAKPQQGAMQLVGMVQCPPGFAATPSTYNPKNPYNQHYTCTGPVVHCMNGFMLEKPVLAYGPPPGPGMIGPPIYGSGIQLDAMGRITFTCRQPQPPPK
jgi:hypothetical protein